MLNLNAYDFVFLWLYFSECMICCFYKLPYNFYLINCCNLYVRNYKSLKNYSCLGIKNSFPRTVSRRFAESVSPNSISPKPFRRTDVSPNGRFAERTFRRMDVSPNGRFAENVNGLQMTNHHESSVIKKKDLINYITNNIN